MVRACILASANQYEEPRPPRRGSHRPEEVHVPQTRPLNRWPEVDEDATPRLPPLTLGSLLRHGSNSCSTREEDAHKNSWMGATHSGNMNGGRSQNRYGLGGMGRYAAHVHPYRDFRKSTRPQAPQGDGNMHFYCLPSPPSPLSDESHGSLEPPTRGLVDTKSVRSSLEMIRQLTSGGGLDRVSVDKSIEESYARSAPQSAACQSIQKRCIYPSCTKISVSRGLCRGHGGGRRCHVPGCTKSAQSRSNFCWAHGGGQRCEADQCMRSRKTKRFCVAHIHLETAASPAAADAGNNAVAHAQPAPMASISAPPLAGSPLPVRQLPSLGQALSSASRSAPNLPLRGRAPYTRRAIAALV